MKKNLMAILSLFFVLHLQAQFSLTGKIIDNQGQPLPGANVYLKEIRRGSAADGSGNYQIIGINAGKYTLQVSFLGYEPWEKIVEIRENQHLNVALSSSDFLSEEVIVNAIRANENTPATYTNLTKNQFRSANLGQDLPYLLVQTPSLVTTSDAGAGIGYTSFRIRGTDANRINVTLNSVPLNDAESQGMFWVDLPDISSSTSFIQIQRGVGTSTNGAGAFGASINLQSTTLNPQPFAETNLSMGSFGTLKATLNVGTGLINNHFTCDVRLSKINSNGYIDRSASDLKSFFISGGYHTKKMLIMANIFSGTEITRQAWYGVPKCKLDNDTAAMNILIADDGWSAEEIQNLYHSNAQTFNRYLYKNQVDHYRQDYYQLIWAFQPIERLKFNAVLHYTKGLGYYESYSYDKGFNEVGLNFPGSTDMIDRKNMDNDFFGVVYSVVLSLPKTELTYGGSSNAYIGRHFGRVIWCKTVQSLPVDYEWYRSKGIKTDYNEYIKVNVRPGEWLSLYGDMQYRQVSHSIQGTDDNSRNLDIDKTYVFLNPKAGALFHINTQNEMYVTVGITNREPNRNNFVDAPPSMPLPKPERMDDYEAGYKLTKENFSFTVNAYFMNYKDQLVLTGAINDVGYAVMTNVDKSYRAGIESSVQIKPFSWIEWQGNITLSQNKIIQFNFYTDNWDSWAQDDTLLGTTDIAFSPALIAGSQFIVKPFSNFSLSWLTQYVGKQYIDNSSSNERKLEAYTVNNLRIEYCPKLKNTKDFSLSLMINNVLNTNYISNAWVYSYKYNNENRVMDGYFPQAGINFLFGFNIKL